MNRRELFRHSLFGAVGAAASSTNSADAREFPQGYDASKDLARSDWTPKLFDEHQNQTIIALSELIIPETDTPGAKTALVNRFLDELLAAETRDVQQSFFNSLFFLDGDCMQRYKQPLLHMPPESQQEYLSFIAFPHSLETWQEGIRSESPEHEHFERLKSWITRAFWSTEAGQKALGWDGGIAHGVFTGCEHQKGH